MNTRELSEDFLQAMRELLGGSCKEYLDSFSENPCYGLRVNTLKSTPEAFFARARAAGWELEPIPWISDGFYYGEGLRPARHPWYYAGLYYLQEPSAMTPASLLPVSFGDRVLDLCAAPGGKSTELAARLHNTGLLFSNDLSNSRARALLRNLELFGAENICVSSEAPEKLARLLPGFFDRILVDAPCSGEGMFRRDPDMVKHYRERGPGYYIPIQRQIVSEAVRMLAPGGLLLYSTCTFNQEENEGCIRFILGQFPEMRLAGLEQKEGFSPGAGLSGCVRLFPHRIRGEGHFMALLEKRRERDTEGLMGRSGALTENGAAFGPAKTIKAAKTGEAAKAGAAGPARLIKASQTEPPGLKPALDFFSHTGRAWDSRRLRAVGEQLYYLPEAFCGGPLEDIKGIRYLRTGLFLGELKKGRFEPSQALAMALNGEEYPDRLMLSSADERVIRYLKGETVFLNPGEAQETPGGWILVCADGFPLGWGRLQNGALKNKYNPGWRWQ